MQAAIIGILASNDGEVHEFFTSVLYPYEFTEGLGINLPGPLAGSLWGLEVEDAVIALPTIISGTLTETIVYKIYNEPTVIEDLSLGQPVLLAGTLAETIVYKTYNEPIAVEDLSVGLPTLVSGTLVTTISYVTFDPPLSATDELGVGLPTLLSGTLT
jgi:hypothetical protein